MLIMLIFSASFQHHIITHSVIILSVVRLVMAENISMKRHLVANCHVQKSWKSKRLQLWCEASVVVTTYYIPQYPLTSK